ncbi:MAG: Kelch repeat-containing protein, partial [Limisphaerales bacterium]
MKLKFAIGSAALLLLTTLAFAQADWTHRTPATSPSARSLPAMAQFGDKVLLFGGVSSSTGQLLGDTWLWDGTNWQQITQFGIFGGSATPPPRSDAAMAYDPLRNAVVMFGGKGAHGILGDTWVFSLQNIFVIHRSAFFWDNPTFTTQPTAREDAAMDYDPILQKVILTTGFGGGTQQDTWAFAPGFSSLFQSIPASWTKISTSTQPSPTRSDSAMAMCGNAAQTTPNQLLLFGGFGGPSPFVLGDNWLLTDSGSSFSWAGPTTPSSNPAPRFSHAMAYYPVSNRVLLFGGGAAGGVFSDTWNGLCGSSVTWSQADPLHNPGAREFMGMATGPNGMTVVMFGGQKFTPPLGALRDTNETWTWGRRAACLPTDGSELQD